MIGGHDFLDPWGNHWQVVDYRDVQFAKTDRVLEGMGLDGLEKSERALAELAREGPRGLGGMARSVLVTGASSGIGHACAVRLARAGWKRLRRRSQRTRTPTTLREHGIEPVELDVTDAAADRRPPLRSSGRSCTGSSTTPASRSPRRSSSCPSTSFAASSR